MHRLVVTIALIGMMIGITPSQAFAQAPVQSGRIVFSTQADWQRGTRTDVQIITNADGELRLERGATRGTFVSEPISLTTSLNAAGVVWHADIPPGTTLTLELRGGPAPDQPGPWQPLTAGELRARSTPDAFAIEGVRPLSSDTRVLQFRATFSTTVPNASPILSDVSISYFDTSAGPPRAINAVPAVGGPATLTVPPKLFPRTSWAGGNPRAYRG
ncbi:MAG: N-acetylmuramoyl-L-alanine amidase, partial [Roseiflexus castenholzii]